jgi:GntR family transcriptional regulator / MocR family aminotransferase
VLIELRLARETDASLQAQIVEQLREQIVSGRLRPGFRLPPSRELARQHNVSRNTIIHAYERLISEGYLSAIKGVRTLVAETIPETCLLIGEAETAREARVKTPRAPTVFTGESLTLVPDAREAKPVVDFWPGRANRALFPIATWRKLANEKLSGHTNELTNYGDPAGLPALRAAVARHVAASRGLVCSAESVIITAGTQEALNIIARMLVTKGTGIVVEDPCYASPAYTFRSYGARLHPVPVDHDGLITDLLPERGVSFAYVTPSHQFPTGATLAAARRRALLAWADRCGAYIVEDDYDSDYNFDGPPALSIAGADGGTCVIYIGTFSKSLGAGVRTGYLIVPPQLVAVARAIKTMGTYGHPWLEQAILDGFLDSGGYQRHLRTIRKACSETLNCLISRLQTAFGPLEIWGLNSGMHVMWLLPEWMPAPQDFRARLAAHGVRIHTLESGGAYCASGLYRDRAILLGYAALRQREIIHAVDIMARVVGDERQAARGAEPARGISQRAGKRAQRAGPE